MRMSIVGFAGRFVRVVPFELYRLTAEAPSRAAGSDSGRAGPPRACPAGLRPVPRVCLHRAQPLHRPPMPHRAECIRGHQRQHIHRSTHQRATRQPCKHTLLCAANARRTDAVAGRQWSLRTCRGTRSPSRTSPAGPHGIDKGPHTISVQRHQGLLCSKRAAEASCSPAGSEL